MQIIKENTQRILRELSGSAALVGAVKNRSSQEVNEAIEGGLQTIGHNYIQEATAMFGQINQARWHFIGHLQQNKVSKAVDLFDMIETVDSLDLARAISQRCVQLNKKMDILIEVNSAQESNKSGVSFSEAVTLATECAKLPNLRLRGLMTMGPAYHDAEELRPYFAATRRLFETIKEAVNIQYFDTLSMGMSESYHQAIKEGATLVRIGSAIFGTRV